MANENGWGDGASNNNIGWGKGAVNNNINWGASHFTSLAGLTDITGQGGGSSFDPDAEAYFTAAGITDTTEKDAVNQLVLDLKGEGSTTNNSDVWSSSIGIYPVSPTSLTASTFNLKNLAKNITWFNSPTHSSLGITGNGIDMYGDAGINILNDIGSNNFGLYVEVDSQNTSSQSEIGANKSSSPYDGGLILPFYAGGARDASAVGEFVFGGNAQVDRTGLLGVQYNTTLGVTERNRNGIKYSSTATPIGIAQNLNIFLMCRNFGGSGALFTNKTHSFYGITNGDLIENQIFDLSISIYKYRYFTLKGIANVEIEAVEYAMSAQIKDVSELVAINNLVKDLKGTGSTTNNTDVWSSLDDIAPISPTSLAAAAYKLKYVNTQQITWANSPTHSSSGVAFNGSTQYGDFNYIPSTAGASLTSASITLSVNGSGSSTEVIYGVIQATTQREAYFFTAASSTVCHLYQTGTTTGVSYTTIDRQGVFITSRRAIDDIEGYEDGVSQNTGTGTASAGTLPSASSFIAANNDGTGTAANHANTTINFVARGSGLTDNQAQDLYDAISTYNTALSR